MGATARAITRDPIRLPLPHPSSPNAVKDVREGHFALDGGWSWRALDAWRTVRGSGLRVSQLQPRDVCPNGGAER